MAICARGNEHARKIKETNTNFHLSKANKMSTSALINHKNSTVEIRYRPLQRRKEIEKRREMCTFEYVGPQRLRRSSAVKMRPLNTKHHSSCLDSDILPGILQLNQYLQGASSVLYFASCTIRLVCRVLFAESYSRGWCIVGTGNVQVLNDIYICYYGIVCEVPCFLVDCYIKLYNLKRGTNTRI